MKIPLRMKEPTQDTSPGDGHVDELADAMAEEREALRALDDGDPYKESLTPKFAVLLNEQENARRLIWRQIDKATAKRQAAQSIVSAAADAAAASMPRSGWGGPIDLQAAQAGARRDVDKRTQLAIRDELTAHIAGEAAAVGASFGEAFIAAANAFEASYADWDGPAALRTGMGKLSLDDLHRQVSVEAELRTCESPMTEIIRTWGAISKSGDAAKIELFTRAARSLAIEVTQTPPAKLAIRMDGRDRVDNERSQAFKFLGFLQDFKIASRPPSLKLAADLLGMARERALILFGSYPPFVVPSEFAIRNSPVTSRTRDAAKKPWLLENFWFQKFLPPSVLALPGWSPIISKTSLGALVRAPRGG
jgi:hypothetical protein